MSTGYIIILSKKSAQEVADFPPFLRKIEFFRQNDICCQKLRFRQFVRIAAVFDRLVSHLYEVLSGLYRHLRRAVQLFIQLFRILGKNRLYFCSNRTARRSSLDFSKRLI